MAHRERVSYLMMDVPQGPDARSAPTSPITIIKIKRFKSAVNKIPYTYMLTPQGLEEKATITLKFLKRKLSEYEEIKRQIKEIANEAEKDESIDLLSNGTLKQLIRIH